MRYVQINSFCNGSTGSIMRELHREALERGDESWMFWGRGRLDAEVAHGVDFTTTPGVCADAALTRLDGRAGFHSRAATRRLLARLDEIDPDVVHLHNLHGYYVNIEMLFDWLAKSRCRVRWTLHDCWAFTGHCAYFTFAGCDRWKLSCACSGDCPQLDAYPKTYSKRSCNENFEDKKRLFTSVPPERMTLVAPSQWLAGLLADSFLDAYPVEVRRNTIDASVFRPTPSDFRERYRIGNRFMVLGVAGTWSERKGLGDFIRLARELDSERFAVVLVGLGKRQMRALPEVVIALKRTESAEELAGIYSAADVFFNPTREDNFPTVNLEAEACGTPVVTYDVGGCAETIARGDSAAVSGYDGAVAVMRHLRQARGLS